MGETGTKFLDVLTLRHLDSSTQTRSRDTCTSASFSADNTARVDLVCHDYGGFTTVQASAAGQSVSMCVPKDDNGNWLPDGGWIAGTAQINDTGLGRDVDEDINPSVSGPPAGGQNGDGLTNFEEYRGFIVRGSQRRTNPFQKDVFISSNLDTGILSAFPNLPTATHRVYGPDNSGLQSEYAASRVINFNHTYELWNWRQSGP